MIQAVIFDLDGTIIETESITSVSYAEIIKGYGKEPTPNEYGLIQIPGIRGDDAWRQLKEKYGIDEDIEVLRHKRRAIYIELLRENIRALPGVVTLLKLCKEHHIKVALATGSQPHIIDLILTTLGIKDYFQVIVNGGEVKRGKPDPECFIRASKKLHILPQYCLVLEDAQFGVMAAKAAGMKVIAAPHKQTTIKQDFSHADLVVPSLEQVDWKTILHLGEHES